jgi:hypothetical protein
VTAEPREKAMSDIERPHTLSKVAYWSLSTLLVVGLALIIFWGLMILFETDRRFGQVLGFAIALIGSILVVAGITRPLYLLKPLLKKGASKDNQEADLKAFRMTFMILGLGLIIGGLIYSFTNNAGYLILCFLLSNLLLFFGVRSKRKR